MSGFVALDPAKFRDPDVTAKGERRATVALRRLDVLWFHTGSLCNLTCAHCYVESSPTNDRLAYLSAAEVRAYLDEAARLDRRPTTVGFTGGEPFLNPELGAMLETSLERGHEALVLTNAARPMMRPRVRASLDALAGRHGARLALRVSLDHFGPDRHDAERGAGSFEESMAGLRWLCERPVAIAVAARRAPHEDEAEVRAGFAALFAREAIRVDAGDPRALVIFPEMDERADVPEITTDCWRLLQRDPDDVMCASSRMVLRRRGADAPAVIACTLLPYDSRFELGASLADALGPVSLNHPHCALFCVLGGASCKG